MKQNNKIIAILGWLLMFVAVGLFCLQMGYLFVHNRFQVEYIDWRLFYIINLFIIVGLYGGITLLFTVRRISNLIALTVTALFLLINGVMIIQHNDETEHIISLSPDFQHVFSVQKDIDSGEAIYYRSYFGILARPKERLSNEIAGEVNVKWLENDIAALTYETKEQKVQQFIGTYGDRKNGLSYYNVGAEIQGEWQGDGVKVVSEPEGIHVTEHGETTLFDWDDIHQYGTLAIVLEQDQEAAWTIALNKDFIVHSDAAKPNTGSILLHKAAIDKEASYKLEYTSSMNDKTKNETDK